MSPGQRQLIGSLIKRYADDSGTETLIGYIADTTGMLNACRSLFDINGRVDSSLANWLSLQCSEYGVGEKEFTRAVSQVLSILNVNNSEVDNYEVLGLTSGATEDQIKTTYRKLSLLYHPDRAKQNGDVGDYDPERFIEINRAYHTLTNPPTNGNAQARTATTPGWNKTRKKRISSRRKKKLMYWGVGAIALLMMISIFGSLSVRKRAMLAGLTEDRGAFIPPEQVIVREPANQIETQVATEVKNTESSSPELLADKHKVIPLPEEAKTQEIVESEPDLTTSESEDEESFQPETGVGVIEPVEQTASAVGSVQANKTEIQSEPDVTETLTGETPAPEKTDEVDEEKPSHGEVAEQAKPVDAVVGESSINEQATNQLVATLQSTSEPQVSQIKPTFTEVSVEEKPQEESTSEADLAATDAVEIAEFEPEGSVEQTKQFDMQEHIEEFFILYQEAYAKRDIINFVKFFTSDAVENDKNFADRISVYKKLFEATKDVSLKINIVQWQEIDNEIHVEGRFVVAIDYKKGEYLSGKGQISFVLLEDTDEMLIALLEYSFDN